MRRINFLAFGFSFLSVVAVINGSANADLTTASNNYSQAGRKEIDATRTGTIAAAGGKIISTSSDFVAQPTIVPEVNEILQNKVIEGVERFHAKGGLGVIMNVNTGEIVAATSIDRVENGAECEQLSPCGHPNRISQQVYENASTLRLINYANAFNSGRVTPATRINVAESLKVGKLKIDDYSKTDGDISVVEAFMLGSNIAAGKIALQSGIKEQRDLLTRLHQLDPLDTGAIKTQAAIFPEPWRTENMVTISFGHGIANTPLHAVAAVAILVNGGKLVMPTFAKRADPVDYQRVVSAEASSDIRFLLRKNVENGSAKIADLPNYSVGGMTATTEKVIDGHYAQGRVLTSFIGVVPADEPKYVIMAMFDEPQVAETNEDIRSAIHSAGVVGAETISSIAPILGIHARDKED